MSFSNEPGARETVREGVAELRDKLRGDLSKVARARSGVSLKPEIACGVCGGAGKLACPACEGSGRSRVVMEDGRQDPCPRCDGAGRITCVDCAGKGLVANRHRKVLIGLLWVGGLAWLMILISLWGRDILPEQRAVLLQRGEHGKAVAAPPAGARLTPGRAVPGQTGSAGVGSVVPGGAQQGSPAIGLGTPPAPGSGPMSLQPGTQQRQQFGGNSLGLQPGSSYRSPAYGMPGASAPQGGAPIQGGNSVQGGAYGRPR